MGVKRSIPASQGFAEIFSNPKKKVSTKHFLLLSKENSLGVARIGVAVRKADIKLAVQRNKIKRKIKGSFELNTLNLPPLDYVVFVRRNISSSEDLIKKELTELWGDAENLCAAHTTPLLKENNKGASIKIRMQKALRNVKLILLAHKRWYR